MTDQPSEANELRTLVACLLIAITGSLPNGSVLSDLDRIKAAVDEAGQLAAATKRERDVSTGALAAWRATVDNQQRTIEMLSNRINAMNRADRDAASDPNGPDWRSHGQLMQALGITDASVTWDKMLAKVREAQACVAREQRRYQELAGAVGVDPSTAPWGSASWDALIDRVNKLYRGAS